MPQESITWKQIQNFWPLIGALLVVAASYWGLYTKVEVLINEVSNTNNRLIEVVGTYKGIMSELGSHETRLTRMETMLDIK